MRIFRRWLCMLFLFCIIFSAAHGQASSISGQSYDAFSRYYQEDVSFINQNDNRHLLPLVLASHGDMLGDGRLAYELIGDTLGVTILTDPGGTIIERCVITLTAPSGMVYGNALYNDFAISGYHSYALLMAMHADPSPAKRYELVVDTVEGMAAGNGMYTRQVGVYTLECVRTDNVVTLSFHNNRAQTDQGVDDIPEDGADSPEAIPELGEDEAAGLL